MKKITPLIFILLTSLLLNGCAVALVTGAAGGYYVGHNYEVQKKSGS